MIGERLIGREAEALRLLEALHASGLSHTLVGGYAVNAYSPLPRYSVDLDVVIARQDLARHSALFGSNGFDDRGAIYVGEAEGLETRKFVKLVGEEEVSVELLVDGIRCRQTEAVWKADEIGKTKRELRVVGVSGSVPSKVASREMLISMKLHSGRDPDLRDVVMLAADADWALVGALSDRGVKARRLSQFQRATDVIGGEQFESRLKAAFGTRREQKTRIGVTLSKIRELRKVLGQQD